MLVLAFDTATPAITVALHDGTSVISASTVVDARSHGELLAPTIERVLLSGGVSRLDLTDVAVGVGPGPYTGLRVGVVTARTLADALDLAIHGVCTLDVLATQVRAADVVDDGFAVATDARRKEVYWARYEPDGHRVDGPAVLRPAELAAHLPSGTPVVGRGADLYGAVLDRVDGPTDPDAATLADMVARGAFTPMEAVPLYLRRPDAVVPGERKRAS